MTVEESSLRYIGRQAQALLQRCEERANPGRASRVAPARTWPAATQIQCVGVRIPRQAAQDGDLPPRGFPMGTIVKHTIGRCRGCQLERGP
jgi:hypothetical protein